MNNGVKVLILIVSLVLAGVLITLGFTISDKGTSRAPEELEKIDNVMDSGRDSELLAYDGATFDGSVAIANIRKLCPQYTVIVWTADATGRPANIDDITVDDVTTSSSLKDADSGRNVFYDGCGYVAGESVKINKKAKFDSVVVYDDEDTYIVFYERK